MFEAIAPEQCGLSSADIANFIKKIESRGAIMHSLLIMRHGKILTEHYWAPFTADFCHRMYSQTKSYTAIAIGLLIGENKLSLDTKLVDIYPEYRGTNPFLDEQTVEMRIFNADGSEGQTCGNGVRCAGAFARKYLGIKSDNTFKSVVFPEPVAPQTKILYFAATAFFKKSAIS